MRRGIKARRTRNEGRVRALEALRAERGARRDEVGRVKAQLQEAERSGRVVLRCREPRLRVRRARRSCEDFTGDDPARRPHRHPGAQRLRQDDADPPAARRARPAAGHGDRGHEARGRALRAAARHARRRRRPWSRTSARARETISVGGVERHVVGYLRDFLFTPEQIQGPVARLSGGERKRLQLAKVLSRPCNLLVLDEPTNDLDLETLELLEELLLEFQGTLLVVSHDRAFLDNVVTSTLVFEGDGRWREYVGGYEDWLRQKQAAEPAARGEAGEAEAGADHGAAAARSRFKEKRELADLPGRIESLEAEKQACSS